VENTILALLGFGKILSADTHRAWRRLLDKISPVEPMFISDYLWDYDL
jgi:hypothetical protein